jgi:hypothetical protein
LSRRHGSASRERNAGGHRAVKRKARRRIDRAREFPRNTDPCVRHVQIMADCLATYGRYHMFAEEPLHCAVSLFATCEALYKARNEIERLKRKLGDA